MSDNNESFKNFKSIKHWPPGALMSIDTRRVGGTMTGVGVVVANDGVLTIGVMWASNCLHAYKTYDVRLLNMKTIERVS